MCCLYYRVRDLSDSLPTIYYLKVFVGRFDGKTRYALDNRSEEVAQYYTTVQLKTRGQPACAAEMSCIYIYTSKLNLRSVDELQIKSCNNSSCGARDGVDDLVGVDC